MVHFGFGGQMGLLWQSLFSNDVEQDVAMPLYRKRYPYHMNVVRVVCHCHLFERCCGLKWSSGWCSRCASDWVSGWHSDWASGGTFCQTSFRLGLELGFRHEFNQTFVSFYITGVFLCIILNYLIKLKKSLKRHGTLLVLSFSILAQTLTRSPSRSLARAFRHCYLRSFRLFAWVIHIALIEFDYTVSLWLQSRVLSVIKQSISWQPLSCCFQLNGFWLAAQ